MNTHKTNRDTWKLSAANRERGREKHVNMLITKHTSIPYPSNIMSVISQPTYSPFICTTVKKEKYYQNIDLNKINYIYPNIHHVYAYVVRNVGLVPSVHNVSSLPSSPRKAREI